MPYVNCRIMEGVLDEDQKAELAEQITEAFARVVGEPVRRLTWVVIDDLSTGHLTIGGRPVTAPPVPV
jgi:4-oxalocrotonate tautomerase